MELIKRENAELLYFFGYTNHPERETTTNFFDFAEHNPDHLKQYMGFRETNRKAMQIVTNPNWKPTKYKVNEDECFDFLPDPIKTQEPARQWAARKLGYEKKPE